MLKLIRYDFRRSRDRILAAMVILVLFHIGIWLSSDSSVSDTVSAHLVAYFSIGAVFLFFASFNYNRNLKSYQRQLLPVKALYTVLSPLLLYWLLLVCLLIIGLLQLGLYILFYSADFLPANFWTVAARSVLQCTWSAGFVLLMIMFASTVARSIPLNKKIWVTLIIVFGLQSAVGYLEELLFSNYFMGIDSAFRFEIVKASDIPSGLEMLYAGSGPWPFFFEAGIALLLIYGMTVLIQKKTEV
ncbi:hypothetical protein [Paenibacillus camerounensis]|uniref:hypothetical protein n=1 Tax=Paenibacillus camerounensis TaxID=1243663 RepID=UPI0005A821C0|nr:hypothetical protein [Paenibacillus camerounensis]